MEPAPVDDEVLSEISGDYFEPADTCSEAGSDSKLSCLEDFEDLDTDVDSLSERADEGNVRTSAAGHADAAARTAPGGTSTASDAAASAVRIHMDGARTCDATGEAMQQGDRATVGMLLAGTGALGAGLQRTQPLSSYEMGQPAAVQAAGASEVDGVESGLLLAAQSPTLAPGKRVINIHSNEPGLLSRLSPKGSNAFLNYPNSRRAESRVKSKAVVVCPLGGQLSLQRRPLRSEGVIRPQAVLITGGARAGGVGLTAGRVTEHTAKVNLLHWGTGEKSINDINVDVRFLHALSHSELAASCVSAAQRPALVGFTQPDPQPPSLVGPSLGSQLPVSIDTPLRNWRIPRGELAGFLLRLQLEENVDYNFRHVWRWGSAREAFQRMAGGHVYPAAAKRAQYLDVMALECRCGSGRPRRGAEDAAPTSAGCPHRLRLSVPVESPGQVIVQERARHQGHVPGPESPGLRLVPEVVAAVEDLAVRHDHSPSVVQQHIHDMLPDLAAPYIRAGCITLDNAQRSSRFNPTTSNIYTIRKRTRRAWNGGRDDVGSVDTFLSQACERGLVEAIVHHQITAADVNAAAAVRLASERRAVASLAPVGVPASGTEEGGSQLTAMRLSGDRGQATGDSGGWILEEICRVATLDAQARLGVDGTGDNPRMEGSTQHPPAPQPPGQPPGQPQPEPAPRPLHQAAAQAPGQQQPASAAAPPTAVVENCQQQVADILIPLAAASTLQPGSGTAVAVNETEHSRVLTPAAQERTPLSSDRRVLGDKTTKPLYSRERRRGPKRKRTGSDSEARSEGGSDVDVIEPAGALVPTARTRKRRKKQGLRDGD